MRRSRHLGGYLLRNGMFVPSLIKAIQRGTITIGAGATSNTATITAVNLNQARLMYLGVDAVAADVANATACRLELTNATTVTALVNSTGSGNRVVSFEVCEFMPGIVRSVQRGTITSTTDTIAAVNTAKAVLDCLGMTTPDTAPGTGEALANVVLTNATTVTAASAASPATVGYQVTEYF